MHGERQDEALAKLQDERSKLEERLRLLEGQASAPGEGSLTETPEGVREQLGQVDRMSRRTDGPNDRPRP